MRLERLGAPHPAELLQMLQDRNNPVRFRNIWRDTLGTDEADKFAETGHR
jgi:hypothetical protein